MSTPDWIDTLFDLLAQFTGGRGGIDHVIVNFGIAAMFWGILLAVASAKRRAHRQPREALLLWGFGCGLARDLLMLLMAMAVALGAVDNDTLHIVFPPLEHALSNLAQVVVAAAFVLFLTGRSEATRRYLLISVSAIVACYAATFWWWAEYIVANPTSKFGQVWCDWLFRIVASTLLAWPIVFLWSHSRGRLRNVIVTALSFFFLHEFLKIPDMALGEAYENLFAPIRHGMYIAAIPLLGYVYVREQADELQSTLENLENLVARRTEALEDTLEKLRIEVIKKEQTAEELEAFAYSVAHDLKTPLRAMEGFSEALTEDYGSVLDSTGHGFLEHIRQGASRMSHLIDDLLHYSRVGRDELVFEPVDLVDLIARVRTSLTSDIASSEAKVEVRTAMPVLHGHRTTLELMFQNLISNAIKFTRKDEQPVVEIACEPLDEGIVLSVRDNGIGIEPECQSRIFEIFQRLHTTESYEGTGIGLAIVKKTVLLHHGSMWVESTPGEGSAFFMKLPPERVLGAEAIAA